MASIVSAGTTSATALNMSADTSGVLQLASNNGTVALTVDTSQRVLFGTASAGGTSLVQATQAGINATSLTTTTVLNLGTRLGFTGVTNSDGYIFGGIAMGGSGEEYAGIAAYDNGSNAATGLKFFVGNTAGIVNAATINSLGQFLIGTGSTVTTDAQLVVSNSGNAGMEFSTTAISGENRLLSYNRASSVYAAQNFVASQFKFLIGATEATRINSYRTLLINTPSQVPGGSGGSFGDTAVGRLVAGDVSNGGFGSYAKTTSSGTQSFVAINNCGYRVTIYSTNSSATARIAQYVIIGLNKGGGTNPTVLTLGSTGSPDWSFSYSLANTYDTLVTVTGSTDNQGTRIFVEQLGS